MRIGEFGLEIRGASGLGSSRPEHDGYVPVGHGEQYSLWLINDSNERTNLYIRVDGLSVGDFQIGPRSRCALERPADGSGRFTFFRSDTPEAQAVGEASIASPDKGLVEVSFVPEARRPLMHLGGYVQHVNEGVPRGESAGYVIPEVGDCTSVTMDCMPANAVAPQAMNFAPGVTGMTGHSSQQFGAASPIVEDLARKVTITLRLVADAMPGRPLPLPGRRSNPVPLPVG